VIDLSLAKPGVSLLAAAAAAAGYLVAAPHAPAGALGAAAGVLILAAGASALNQYQEREIDARMERTSRRPLPSGAVRPDLALALAILLITAGLLILDLGGRRPMILGGLAVAWYNGIYTPMKKRSAVAAVPGALAGALAPAVGAAFAGARSGDARIVALALVLFIWQIPHFWLLVLGRSGDFRRAGLPNLLDVFPERQARRVVFIWVLATAAASIVVAGWGAFGSAAARAAVLAVSLWLAAGALRFRLSPARLELRLFRTMNVHMAALLLAICLDRLLV
jgi:heme o synthase